MQNTGVNFSCSLWPYLDLLSNRKFVDTLLSDVYKSRESEKHAHSATSTLACLYYVPGVHDGYVSKTDTQDTNYGWPFNSCSRVDECCY